MLRFDNSLTVHYLPVHNPTKLEKKNPSIYAKNIRKKISNYSKLPILDVCFEDGRLMSRFIQNYKGDPSYAFCEILRLFETYGLTYTEIEGCFDSYMERFSAFTENKTGLLDVKYFKEITGLNDSDLKEFFGKNVKTDDKIRIIDAVEGYCKAIMEYRKTVNTKRKFNLQEKYFFLNKLF